MYNIILNKWTCVVVFYFWMGENKHSWLLQNLWTTFVLWSKLQTCMLFSVMTSLLFLLNWASIFDQTAISSEGTRGKARCFPTVIYLQCFTPIRVKISNRKSVTQNLYTISFLYITSLPLFHMKKNPTITGSHFLWPFLITLSVTIIPSIPITMYMAFKWNNIWLFDYFLKLLF